MNTTKPYPHRRRPRPGVALAALAAVVLLAGCARTGAAGSGQDISHPTGPHDLILRVDTSGGFISPQAVMVVLPEFSLFGDGTVVEPGATPMIYPGPALPSAVSLHIDEAGIQAILHAARAAGLMGPSRHVGGVGIPDVGTTTITVVAGGARHVTTFNAAGLVGAPPVAEPGAVPGAASGDTTQTGSSAPATGSGAESGSAQPKMELTAIAAFRNKLINLDWLPKGSVTSDSQYRPQALAVFVRPGSPKGGAELHEPTVDWPLAAKPLSSFGDPFGQTLGIQAVERCGVVAGADFDSMWTAASHANQLTPWRSEGQIYALTFGVVLPDGWGACATPTA